MANKQLQREMEESAEFGRFLQRVAALLNETIRRALEEKMGLTKEDIAKIEENSDPNYAFLQCLEEREIISPTNIERLLEALRNTGYGSLANKVKNMFEKKPEDADPL